MHPKAYRSVEVVMPGLDSTALVPAATAASKVVAQLGEGALDPLDLLCCGGQVTEFVTAAARALSVRGA